MKIYSWIIFGLILAILSSCVAPQTRTQKGAVYGTTGGAAVGALAGQLAGHSTKSTLIGAAIGAAVGGLSGTGVAHYMDKQEQALRQAVAASQAADIERQGNILSVTVKSDFLFDVNSSVVKSGAYSDIDRLARVLNQYPATRIRVEGYTDNTGTEEYNMKLSQRRAEAVKQLLISKGVSPNRITAMGYGESRPKASNATPYGRQLNRRVEIYIESR
ncbi:MAG: OmpA family protein [Nitrospiraceae bacterium]|nr:OmpA family protein [Nitrospiraceae bacterium]